MAETCWIGRSDRRACRRPVVTHAPDGTPLCIVHRRLSRYLQPVRPVAPVPARTPVCQECGMAGLTVLWIGLCSGCAAGQVF